MAAKMELVMFNPRLPWTRPFVPLVPAAIDKDPEIINITDAEIIYPAHAK